ncbi:MAG: GGDEF domain-containing protein [Gemmatimonadetes bacterium]|nr:GGDEF domain-containing protein [Gemmatimonadota bacterium]
MYDRRTEDRLTGRMLYLRPSSGRGGERKGWRELRRDESADRPLDARAAFERLSGADSQLLLLDLQDDGVWLLLGGAMARLPHPADPAGINERARQEAATWLRRNVTRWRRLELPTNLIGYTQALAAAASPTDVCQALADAALRIFGGHHAFVFERDPASDDWRSVWLPGDPAALRNCVLEPAAELGAVGALLPRDARLAQGGSLATLRVFFEGLGAGLLIHAPVGSDRVLFITERRDDRTIPVEEWQILSLLAEQAESAFGRIRLFEEARNLSLTDELTGLPNRRHMRLVLNPAFAAAQRGAPLAVLLLDLDNFKQIIDLDGHLAGDRGLRQGARGLAAQGRGTDLVVRFGGDEFVVIFPGGNRASAISFAERVRKTIPPRIDFSVGIAEYGPEQQIPDDLLGAADADLYRAKRSSGPGDGAEPAEAGQR